jgi:queuine tRNA-ribosyltransferase
MKFTIQKRDPHSQARLGVIETMRGKIETPFFMPVATLGAVKAILPEQITKLGFGAWISNSFHLYLRPGSEIVQRAGGLHRFAAFNGFIATDSGGFQVYSLSELKEVSEEGVKFISPFDGSRHFWSPESVIQTQWQLGSDFVMPLDVCINLPAERSAIEAAWMRTKNWARRSRVEFDRVQSDNPSTFEQNLFGIVQGGNIPELRRESACTLAEMNFAAYAIGGLSVGEPAAEMIELVSATTEHLPIDRPRYLMGVGSPQDIIECVKRGIDMFDCVLPTRNARNGKLFTRKGSINIRNKQYANDPNPIDSGCTCYTCTRFSRSYLRHLAVTKEIGSSILGSLHNLHFYAELFREIRRRLDQGVGLQPVSTCLTT